MKKVDFVSHPTHSRGRGKYIQVIDYYYSRPSITSSKCIKSQRHLFSIKEFSKNNATYLIISSHRVKSGCWWFGNKDWTFLTIIYKSIILFHFVTYSSWVAIWQNNVWHESWSIALSFSMWKKIALIDIYPYFLKSDSTYEHSLLSLFSIYSIFYWSKNDDLTFDFSFFV